MKTVLHTVVAQPAHNVSPGAPSKVLTSVTHRGPSGDSRRTNTKIYDLLIKLYFSILLIKLYCILVLVLHICFCFFRGKTII